MLALVVRWALFERLAGARTSRRLSVGVGVGVGTVAGVVSGSGDGILDRPIGTKGGEMLRKTLKRHRRTRPTMTGA